MKNEETQRAIEFIIQQQAQYAARFDKDEARLARLEESFKMLVELARGADERQDRMDETLATLSNTMNQLVQRMMALAEAQGQLDARVAELAREADERQGALSETLATLSQTMNELAQRTLTDESRLARLEESFTMLVALAHKHE